MKNFLILIMSLFFAVLSNASPPPLPVPEMKTDESRYMARDQVQAVQIVQEFQYLAVADIDSPALIEVKVLRAKAGNVANLPIIAMQNTLNQLVYLKKPPSDNKMKAIISSSKIRQTDKQYCNYGYPFTANRCVLS